MGLCFSILDSSRGIRRGGVAQLTEEVNAGLGVRKQYIALAELFAPSLALHHEGESL